MPRLDLTALLLCTLASTSCAPCRGVDVVTADDGATSRRLSAYLSSPVELTVVDHAGQLLFDVRYTVDGAGSQARDKATADVTFANGHVERMTAIAPPYTTFDHHAGNGDVVATTYRARFPVGATLAQHLTTTPIVAIHVGTPGRAWTFEAKQEWADELVVKSRCVVPPAACQTSDATLAASVPPR